MLEKNERYCQIMKRDCFIEHPTEKSSTVGEEVGRKVSTERVKDHVRQASALYNSSDLQPYLDDVEF